MLALPVRRKPFNPGRKEEVVMKAIAWVAGTLGIIVALFGVIDRLVGAGTIKIMGSHHPSTFLIVGILFVAIGIWLAVLGLQAKK